MVAGGLVEAVQVVVDTLRHQEMPQKAQEIQEAATAESLLAAKSVAQLYPQWVALCAACPTFEGRRRGLARAVMEADSSLPAAGPAASSEADEQVPSRVTHQPELARVLA